MQFFKRLIVLLEGMKLKFISKLDDIYIYIYISIIDIINRALL